MGIIRVIETSFFFFATLKLFCSPENLPSVVHQDSICKARDAVLGICHNLLDASALDLSVRANKHVGTKSWASRGTWIS